MDPEESARFRLARFRRGWDDGCSILRGIPLEAGLWVIGLAAMATMDPRGEHLFRLCPLDGVGVSFCPGCGLGHAVAYLARGAFAESVQAHPLGVPAVLVLVGHVGRLVRDRRHVHSRLSSAEFNSPLS